MNSWNLVSTRHLARRGDNYALDVVNDTLHNRMAILGDRVVGIESPIEVIAYAPSGAEPGDDGDPTSIPEGFRADRRLIRVGHNQAADEDMDFALFLALNGPWGKTFERHAADGKVMAIQLTAEPAGDAANSGIRPLGAMSAVYSRYFDTMTSTPDGSPGALDMTATPAMIADFLARDPKTRSFGSYILEVVLSPARM